MTSVWQQTISKTVPGGFAPVTIELSCEGRPFEPTQALTVFFLNQKLCEYEYEYKYTPCPTLATQATGRGEAVTLQSARCSIVAITLCERPNAAAMTYCPLYCWCLSCWSNSAAADETAHWSWAICLSNIFVCTRLFGEIRLVARLEVAGVWAQGLSTLSRSCSARSLRK